MINFKLIVMWEKPNTVIFNMKYNIEWKFNKNKVFQLNFLNLNSVGDRSENIKIENNENKV